jgi:hypothetical protein
MSDKFRHQLAFNWPADLSHEVSKSLVSRFIS